MPKIVHYRINCIGCNSCVEHDAEHWKLSEQDGRADLRNARKEKDHYILDITKADIEKAKCAAKDCPARVIKVIE